MTSSWTDLTQFWECPRRLGFRKLGYKPVARNEAITTGSFVHEGLRAYFAGGAFDVGYASEATSKARDEAVSLLDRIENREQKAKLLKQTREAHGRASKLLNRYLNSYANDYGEPLSEVEVNHAKVVCHIDLIAKFRAQGVTDKGQLVENELVIVDFKTSKSPDLRWYDFSGQCDMYAYVLWGNPKDTKRLPINTANPVSLIIYDIISEEGLFRHIRRPNLERGKRLFQQVDTLDNYETSHLLGKPQYQWSCPKCSYFLPCWLAETESMKAGIEFLMSNYIKGG